MQSVKVVGAERAEFKLRSICSFRASALEKGMNRSSAMFDLDLLTLVAASLEERKLVQKKLKKNKNSQLKPRK